MPVEKLVDYKTRAKKATRCGNSGEFMATLDGVKNSKTPLDSGSDCRIVPVVLGNTLSYIKFSASEEAATPDKSRHRG